MMIDILDERPTKLVQTFVDDYSSLFDLDRGKLNDAIDIAIRCHKGKLQSSVVVELAEVWYESLKLQKPDYSVYSHENYIVDIWLCWQFFSRNYLREVRKYEIQENVKSVLDLGCGIGYTSIALKRLFRGAIVYGLNMKDTYQYNFCYEMSHSYGFKMVSDYTNLKEINLLFASEFFEHVESPMDYFRDLMKFIRPSLLIISNSFNTYGVGHFTTYTDSVAGHIPQERISRLFNQLICDSGYIKLDTGFWNNKPTIWKYVE